MGEEQKELSSSATWQCYFKDLKDKVQRVPRRLMLGFVLLGFLAGICGVFQLAQISVACALMIDGEQAAVVKSESEAEEVIEDMIASQKKELGEAVILNNDITYEKKKTRQTVVTPVKLREILQDKLDFITPAVALEVDGKVQVVLKNRQEAESVLTKIRDYYRDQTEGKIISVDLSEQVNFKELEVSPGKLVTIDQAFAILKDGREKIVKHKVVEGDSLWLIARENNMTVNQLMEANPQLTSDKLSIDQELNLVRAEPLINVLVTSELTRKQVIPCPVQTKNSSTLYAGQQRVQEKGQDGTKEVLYRIVTKNGAVLEKEEIKTEVLQEPEAKVVLRGTKRIVASRGTGGSGRLAWPVNGRINSGYGYRGSEFHAAIDIGASVGTSIRAAESGRVISAGWAGNYGRLVAVDHGNGLVTRYAHCSSIKVSVGQRVSRGQVIAAVGSSGRSTGPHLHFEVLVNGARKNPLAYLR